MGGLVIDPSHLRDSISTGNNNNRGGNVNVHVKTPLLAARPLSVWDSGGRLSAIVFTVKIRDDVPRSQANYRAPLL